MDKYEKIKLALETWNDKPLTNNPYNTEMTMKRAKQILKNGIDKSRNLALPPDSDRPVDSLNNLAIYPKKKT